jgi:hypothetical protein
VIARETPTSSPPSRAVTITSAFFGMARMVSGSLTGRRSARVERTRTSMKPSGVRSGSRRYVTVGTASTSAAECVADHCTPPFAAGRLHSYRHYFCSTCANRGVPEQVVMEWLGHADSKMVRHYYHLHDAEAQRQMKRLNFVGEAGGAGAGGEVS